MDVEPFFLLWLDKNTITIHTCTRTTTTPMMMCITYGIEKVYISSGTRKPNLNEVKIDNETHHLPFVKGSQRTHLENPSLSLEEKPISIPNHALCQITIFKFSLEDKVSESELIFGREERIFCVKSTNIFLLTRASR